MNYSTDTNFIIFTLDSVDAWEMKTLLESSTYSKDNYAQTLFEDFTFYNNMTGAYPFTNNSVAFLLSGEWYENQIPSVNYFHDAFKNARLFKELSERNFELNIYFDSLPPLDSDYYRFSNIMDSKNENLFSIKVINMINQITALKYLPFELKPLVSNKNNDFNVSSYLQLMTPIEENCSIFTPNNSSFYSYVTTNQISYSSNKVFKYIHIDGAHAPFVYNKNIEEIPDATYKTSLEASLTLIETYIDKLKAANVYDNSVIIIMSDHGYDSSSDAIKDSYFFRQNPIFFVKGKEEHHNYSVSAAPVSFEDLNKAYLDLMNGAMGTDIFEYEEGDVRKRRWLYYEGGNGPITEYIQPAEAWNRNTIYSSGTQYIFKK